MAIKDNYLTQKLNRHHQMNVIGHGTIILAIGFFKGFPLARKIAQKKDYERWRMAHSATIVAGLYMILCGLYLKNLPGSSIKDIFSLTTIIQGYGFTIGSLMATLFHVRGMKFKGSISNKIAYISYIFGGVLNSTISILLFIYFAFHF